MEEFDISLRIYYTPLEILGKGAFGIVWKCMNNSNKQVHAVKILNIYKKSPKQVDSLLFEAHLLEKLHNDHIVKFIGTRCTNKFICIETELLKGGTLKSRLNKGLSTSEAIIVMQGLLTGVAYLHSKNIVHRDIKPENIIFADNSFSSLKITDFGLSRTLQNECSLEDTCGTTLYMAPEQAQLRLYSEAVDIWSCGIILYIMMTGTHPLFQSGDDTKSYFKKLLNPKWKLPDEFPSLAKDLFEHMVRFNPVNRYTAETALKHPWITGNQNAAIPMTYYEKIRLFQSTESLQKIFNCAFFLSCLRRKTTGYSKVYKEYVLNIDKHQSLPITSPSSDCDSSFLTVRTEASRTRSNWSTRLTLNFLDESVPKQRIKVIPPIAYSHIFCNRLIPVQSTRQPPSLVNASYYTSQQVSPQKSLNRIRRDSLNPKSRLTHRYPTVPSNSDISKIYANSKTKRAVSVLNQKTKRN